MAKRPFGQIPDWAMRGPISVENYDLRMEWYGATIKQWRDNWPFLSHDPDVPATADEQAWERYFDRHLGGHPRTYKLFRKGAIRYLNLPEVRPEVFDISYDPRE